MKQMNTKYRVLDYNAIALLFIWTLQLIFTNVSYAIEFARKSDLKLELIRSQNEIIIRNSKAIIHPNNGLINVNKQNANTISSIDLDNKSIENHIGEFTLADLVPGAALPNEVDNDLDDSGPSSPEFMSFESVSTDKMVDPFTGDFTYNLPLLDVPGAHDGGYPITLAYHSGNSPEEEASWVGYGFTLSPGAINRSKRGFPDDVMESEVSYYNKMPTNVTVSITPTVTPEAFSFDKNMIPKRQDTGGITLSIAPTLSYNNYKGFRKRLRIGVSHELGSLDLNFDNGKRSFTPRLNLYRVFRKLQNDKSKTIVANPNSDASTGRHVKSRYQLARSREIALNTFKRSLNQSVFSSYAIGNDVGVPMPTSQYKGNSISLSIGFQMDAPSVIVGGKIELAANVTSINYTDVINKKAYGYLYSSSAYDGQDFIMDYHMEKEGDPNYRDKYLPLTVSDFDMFSVSAEGLSGSFRAFWKKGGLFIPNETESSIFQYSRGLPTVHGGTVVGAGIDAANGNSKNTLSGNWYKKKNTNNNGNSDLLKFQNSGQDSVFFRFNSDPSGSALMDQNLDNVAPSVNKSDLNTSMVPNTLVTQNYLNTDRVGRGNQIEYVTNLQIRNRLTVESGSSLNVPKILYDYDYLLSNATNFINRSESVIESHIGEFVVNNSQGNTYVFALPVYSRAEKNMLYNVPYDNRIQNTISDQGDYKIYANGIEDFPHTGEEHKYPYATSYLLTSIRASNYKDANNDGIVNNGDLGGYTKFSYSKKYGSTNKSVGPSWYEWRMPHSGLMLNQGNLSDRSDDMGSFNSGEKEVYNLRKIETQTHVAYFITNESQSEQIGSSGITIPAGSQTQRPDGISAHPDNFVAAKEHVNGSKRMPYLEKIILYAKSTVGGVLKLSKIKTVNFRYAHEGSNNWSGVWPNSNGTSNGKGKLTLVKVWIDEVDILNAKITPYEFKYEYPDPSIGYPAKYNTLAQFYSQFNQTISGNDSEKPDYIQNHAYNVDRWGSYQAEGKLRRQQFNPYVDQTPFTYFDPAAWELKQIKLPTGAEIHVQYEQDDYGAVQDRTPTVMVNFNSSFEVNNSYNLNLSGVGITDVTEYEKYLKKYFENGGLVYFKFLYEIRENSSLSTSIPLNSANCNAQYIDGYIRLNPDNISKSGNNIIVQLGSQSNPALSTIDGLAWLHLIKKGTTLPRYLCFDYFVTETGKQAGLCDLSSSAKEIVGSASAESVARDLFKFYVKNFVDLASGYSNYCASVINELSYLRLPIMPTTENPGKLGGGLRVKRILMYDKGVETSEVDKALYGTEFIYQLED